MAQEIKMSASGLKAMQDELEYLKTVRRKELAEEIKDCLLYTSRHCIFKISGAGAAPGSFPWRRSAAHLSLIHI